MAAAGMDKPNNFICKLPVIRAFLAALWEV
jgi:hypothetical protein